ncbi:uncharacterized protein BDW70DRAFT_165380 [Aspergillus foveolatus]|uniref:uncharacterized protein n=1 Tax=Aspergillus foveolatus TaxID=210207 RepID=UPI003CCD45AF
MAIKNRACPVSYKVLFMPQAWIERLITFIAALQLPFQLVEYPEFHALLEIAWLAPYFPEIPAIIIVYYYLQEIVEGY